MRVGVSVAGRLTASSKVLTNTQKISTPQGDFEVSLVFEKLTAAKSQ